MLTSKVAKQWLCENVKRENPKNCQNIQKFTCLDVKQIQFEGFVETWKMVSNTKTNNLWPGTRRYWPDLQCKTSKNVAKLWTYGNVKSRSSPQTNNMWQRTRHYICGLSDLLWLLRKHFQHSNSISEDKACDQWKQTMDLKKC